MGKTYGVRDIARNPSILKIGSQEIVEITDKRANKLLGIYIGEGLAKDFVAFLEKKSMLESAKKIKELSKKEYSELEGTLSDGL
jgi:hypothetical protein